MGTGTETDEFVTPPSTPPPDALEIVVEQRLNRATGEGWSSSMTIFRVPAHVRDASKELYEPRLVSVGPYYRGREALRAMEQHKWRCLRELFDLYPEASRSRADCVRAVRRVEHRARRCYSERTDIFDAAAATDFAEMLLLDGCFVLMFLIKCCNDVEDMLCDVGWGHPQLLSDMLLLENQIPFFVLEALFRALSKLSPEGTRLSLLELVLPAFKLGESSYLKERTSRVVPVQGEEIHHLLHLVYEASVPRAEELASVPASPPPLPRYEVQLRQMGLRFKMALSKRFALVRDVTGWLKLSSSMALLRKAGGACFSKFRATMPPPTETDGSPQPPPASPPSAPMVLVLPSVTLLREAGVRFDKKASPRHKLDITFDASRGVLSMPRLEIDYTNKAQLVNLVAFEQTMDGLRGRGVAKPMSSYATLLACLARGGKDVEHLQKRGIIDNLLNDDDDAAKQFFQQLGDCSSLDYGNHLFSGIYTDLNQYYYSSWRRHKARFLREHCSSPWAVLALVVAVCAFCFALFKFSITVYGIVHHHYCNC